MAGRWEWVFGFLGIHLGYLSRPEFALCPKVRYPKYLQEYWIRHFEPLHIEGPYARYRILGRLGSPPEPSLVFAKFSMQLVTLASPQGRAKSWPEDSLVLQH